MWVCLYVRMVTFQYRAKKCVLRVTNRLDDETVVTGEVEEGSGLARLSEFREYILCGEREEIISRVEVKTVLAKLAEDPGSIVLELEIVLGRWC